MQYFTAACAKAGLSPFVAVQNPNPAIRNFLAKRRKLYVRYMDLTNFMQDVRVRKIVKDAYLTDYGFAVRVEGWVTVADPRWFAKVKTTPGWRFSLAQDKEHRHVIHLDPGITLYVRNPNIRSPVSWYVGYEVHCPITPRLPNFKPATILSTLWDPTAAVIRPKNTLPQRRL